MMAAFRDVRLDGLEVGVLGASKVSQMSEENNSLHRKGVS